MNDTHTKRVYAEIGFGNETFLSTEIEEGDAEFRLAGFLLPDRVKEWYVRVWMGKTVYILSTKGGFRTMKKDRKAIKFLFGMGGEGADKIEHAAQKLEPHEQKILALLKEKGRIKNDDVEGLLGVSDATATRYLDQLERKGQIRQEGMGKGTTYTLL